MTNIEKYRHVRIITSNCAEKIGALLFLSNLTGVPVDAEVLSNARKGNFEYPNVGLNGTLITGWLASPKNPNYIPVPFVDMYRIDDFLPKPYVEVKLNSTHTAYVYPDKIVVGCQTFPTTIIGSMAAALEQLRNQKK